MVLDFGSFSRLAVAFLALSLGACASGPPKSALQTLGTVPQGSTAVPILVATMREQTQEPPGLMFSGERSRELNYADVIISMPPNHQTGQLEIGSDPSKSIAVVSRDYLDRREFLAKVRKDLAKRKPADRDILVFIHGYNTRFDEARFFSLGPRAVNCSPILMIAKARPIRAMILKRHCSNSREKPVSPKSIFSPIRWAIC